MQALSANSGNNSAALFSLFMSSVPVIEEGSFSATSIAPPPGKTSNDKKRITLFLY